MTTLQRYRPTLLLPFATLALGVALVGCGGEGTADGTSSDSYAEAEGDLADAAAAAGVPEECQAAFPLALEPADAADADFPADWPDLPVEATLCSTGGTLDDTTRTVDYATSATPTEVLDAYEATLPATYETTREDQGLGEVLNGTDGTFSFQVQPGDGRFTIFLSAS
jgi:hypothetical protein